MSVKHFHTTEADNTYWKQHGYTHGLKYTHVWIHTELDEYNEYKYGDETVRTHAQTHKVHG